MKYHTGAIILLLPCHNVKNATDIVTDDDDRCCVARKLSSLKMPLILSLMMMMGPASLESFQVKNATDIVTDDHDGCCVARKLSS